MNLFLFYCFASFAMLNNMMFFKPISRHNRKIFKRRTGYNSSKKNLDKLAKIDSKIFKFLNERAFDSNYEFMLKSKTPKEIMAYDLYFLISLTKERKKILQKIDYIESNNDHKE